MTGLAAHSWSIEDSIPIKCTFHCDYCRVIITLHRPIDNHRPLDGELRSHGIPARCEMTTVAEVMES